MSDLDAAIEDAASAAAATELTQQAEAWGMYDPVPDPFEGEFLRCVVGSTVHGQRISACLGIELDAVETSQWGVNLGEVEESVLLALASGVTPSDKEAWRDAVAPWNIYQAGRSFTNLAKKGLIDRLPRVNHIKRSPRYRLVNRSSSLRDGTVTKAVYDLLAAGVDNTAADWPQRVAPWTPRQAGFGLITLNRMGLAEAIPEPPGPALTAAGMAAVERLRRVTRTL